MSKLLTQMGQLCLTTAFCLTLTSCNKSEFYQKDYLGAAADAGGVQGGADAGGIVIVGGTSGSSTGGSTDGSAQGGTSGGSSTGSTVGGTTGGTTTGGATAGATTGGTTGATAYTDVTENFQQNAAQTKKLDIVWVIDDSGSMSDEQAELGSNFNVFINDFVTKNVDFRMGITTTDCSSDAKCGKLVTGSDTKLTSAMAAASKSQFLADFNSLVKVGTSGSGTERGLKGAQNFVMKHQSLIRSDAYLAVVILSDEEDQSGGEVAAYTDYLKSLKSSAGLVKVYSIVDVNKTNSGGGITVGGDRYIAASEKTAGVAADITHDFAQVLSDMGDSIINLLDSFALAANPIAGSLKVYVNDQLVTNYSFDAASRSIKFDPNSLPQVGANIKVTYKK